MGVGNKLHEIECHPLLPVTLSTLRLLLRNATLEVVLDHVTYLVVTVGFEPTTFRVSDECSTQTELRDFIHLTIHSVVKKVSFVKIYLEYQQ